MRYISLLIFIVVSLYSLDLPKNWQETKIQNTTLGADDWSELWDMNFDIKNCDSINDFVCPQINAQGYYTQLLEYNIDSGMYSCGARNSRGKLLSYHTYINKVCTSKSYVTEADQINSQIVEDSLKKAQSEANELRNAMSDSDSGVLNLPKFLVAFFTFDNSIIDLQKTLQNDKITFKEGYSFPLKGDSELKMSAARLAGENTDNSASSASFTEALFKNGSETWDFLARAYAIYFQIAFSLFIVVFAGFLLHKAAESGTSYISTLNQEGGARFSDGADDNLAYKVVIGLFVFIFFFMSPNLNKATDPQTGEQLTEYSTFFMGLFREGLYKSVDVANYLSKEFTASLVGSEFKKQINFSKNNIIEIASERNRMIANQIILNETVQKCDSIYSRDSYKNVKNLDEDISTSGTNPYFLAGAGDNLGAEIDYTISKYQCSQSLSELEATKEKLISLNQEYDNAVNQSFSYIDGSGGGLLSQGEKAVMTANLMYSNQEDLGMFAAPVNVSTKLFFETVSDTNPIDNTHSVAESKSAVMGRVFNVLPYTMLPGFDEAKNIGCQAIHTGMDFFSTVSSAIALPKLLGKIGVDAAKGAVPFMGSDAEESYAEEDMKSRCSGYLQSLPQVAGTIFAYFIIDAFITYIPILTILVVGVLLFLLHFFHIMRFFIVSPFAIIWIFARGQKQKMINLFEEAIQLAIKLPILVFAVWVAYQFSELYPALSGLLFSVEMQAFHAINEEDIEFSFKWLFSESSINYVQSLFRGWFLYFIEGMLSIVVAVIAMFGIIKFMSTVSDLSMQSIGFDKKSGEADFMEQLDERSQRYQNPF